MNPLSVMLVAGEASGDLLAAELAEALRAACVQREVERKSDAAQPVLTPLAPQFFGAGGPRMAEAGVDLAVEMTQHAVIGVSEAIRHYRSFLRRFKLLFRQACARQPDVIICVDFGWFNGRFARAVRRFAHRQSGFFCNWRPRIVQFVSPQVWASRPSRAFRLASDLDLLLVTFPFERDWYAQRFPFLPVQFVGNPVLERHGSVPARLVVGNPESPKILLLPGSRAGEVRRHLPIVHGAANLIRKSKPGAQFTWVTPTAELKHEAEARLVASPFVRVVAGPVADELMRSDLAITKSGTITLECAWFGVPAVVFYRTSWANYFLAKQVVQVNYLAMPNLLAGRPVYPEFIQHEATPENLAEASLALLNDRKSLEAKRLELLRLIQPLRRPGACQRAARAILDLLD